MDGERKHNTRPRIGPRMRDAIAFIRSNPGCTKLAVVEHIAPTRHINKQYGYAVVDRCMKAGLVRGTYAHGRWSLYAVEGEPC